MPAGASASRCSSSLSSAVALSSLAKTRVLMGAGFVPNMASNIARTLRSAPPLCARASTTTSGNNGTLNANARIMTVLADVRAFSSASSDPSSKLRDRRNLGSMAMPLQAVVDPSTTEASDTGPLLTHQRTPYIDVVDEKTAREYIRDYFHTSYNKTEDLFDILRGEAPYYLKSEPLRHPPIFYLGHTACFYINKLLLAKVIRHRVNPKIEHMCAVGVDEMSWDDLNTDHYDWPSIAEVRSYRAQVRDIVDDVIQTLPMERRLGWESDWWPVLMGIEHENIHTETSSAIFRQVDLAHINPQPTKWPLCPVASEHPAPENELVFQGATEVVFDKSKANAKYYGWDNEFGHKVVPVKEHRASKYLVSNAEFLEFVEAGGYHDRQWWSDEGWTWVSFEKKGGLSGIPRDHPRWWVKQDEDPPVGHSQGGSGSGGSGWKLRCLQEEIPMPWSWPACVNQLEAKAFCNWKSARDGVTLRLPSEAEWYAWRASGGEGFGDTDQPAWKPNGAPGNINLDYYASESPVDMFPWGDSGLYDVVGNVWQWTETPMDALPGYEVHPYYDDFSSPTFDGLHSIIKGGSWISIGCNGATKDSRYAFRRHFYQHAGFRYVESAEAVDQSMTVMELDPDVARELDSQYTLPEVFPGCRPFASECADLVRRATSQLFDPQSLNGLRFGQLGCSTGRACFELAPLFRETVGFDHTARRIQHAVRLQDGQACRFVTPQDGEIQDFHSVTLDELGLESDAARDSLQFLQADACNIDVYKVGTFDVLLAANVLETLYAPRQFLACLHELTNPGGIVLLSTTCNWDAALTPAENWVGGFKCDTSGENVSTSAALEEVLSTHFERADIDGQSEVTLPCVNQSAAQTYTIANSTFSAWRRKL